MKTETDTSWVQRQRLEFIEFKLFWEGLVNRGDLVRRFGISMQQASLDFARYAEVAPGNAVYDRQKKAYLPTPAFQPCFGTPEAGRYLGQLLGITLGLQPREATSLGWIPEAAAVPSPPRNVAPHILRLVLEAIRMRRVLSIDYQSMSREPDRNKSPSRTVSPHALVHDGVRWHVRAFCHRRDEFSDFVLSRILQARLDRESSVNPEDDVRWRTHVTVTLAPAPDLTAEQKSAVERDFGMVNGATKVVVREALLFYVLQQLGSSVANATRQVIVLNEDALGLLVRTRKR